MTDLCLNLGCDQWKLSGFTNIDLNPEVNPDLVLDLNSLTDSYEHNTVDFIYAGHILEHLIYEESLGVMKQCYQILKPHRTLLAVVPDYVKSINEPIEVAEKIVLANGDHRMLMSGKRLERMLAEAGFQIVTELTNLLQNPYLIVSDRNNPVADPWQSAFLAMKLP